MSHRGGGQKSVTYYLKWPLKSEFSKIKKVHLKFGPIVTTTTFLPKMMIQELRMHLKSNVVASRLYDWDENRWIGMLKLLCHSNAQQNFEATFFIWHNSYCAFVVSGKI